MENLRIKDLVKTNVNSYTKNDKWEFINYLDTGNLTNNVISEIVHLIPNKDTIPSRAKRKVKKGDILYSTVRPNQCHFGFIDNLENNMLVSTGFAVLEPIKDKVNGKYLYYYLTQKEIVNYLQSVAEGTVSTYPSIQPKDIEKININLPDLATQNKIASILSAYDDLIEKNNRRMEILRGSAEELYKEWFVRFRFPNHQNTKFINGIPQGWEIKKYADEINIKYGKGLATDELLPKGYPVFGSNGIIGYYSSYMYEKPQILISCRGASSGVINISLPYSFVTSNSLVCEMCDKTQSNFEYLKYYFLNTNLVHYQTGSAQPQITIDNIKNLKIIIPAKYIQQKFSDYIINIDNELLLLKNQNELLKQQRDLLLPRLMSGKINVTP